MFNVEKENIEFFESFDDDNGNVKVKIRLKKEVYYCPKCDKKLVLNGIRNRKINHKVLSDRNLIIHYEARRYRCLNCNHTEYEKNPFSLKGFKHSILVINQLMLDLHNPQYNYTMLAQKYNMSVNEVINYFDSFATCYRIELPINLGIDEIHSNMAKRKNASYLGVLVNNDRFSLIDILPSRNKSDLNNYFQFIPQSERDKVKYVTIDMWTPYKEITLKWLKNAIIAVDPFHVIKHLTDSFDNIRIKVMNRYSKGTNAYYLLKSWNKLLMSDKYKLNGERVYNSFFKMKLNYGDLKKMILDIDEELKLAYELKELYRNFNKRCEYKDAEKELNELINIFQRSEIKEYEIFIQILIKWKKEIINSFIISNQNHKKLSNAKVESMNNSIRTYLNISKGTSNYMRFRKRMLYCFNDELFYNLTNKLTSLKRDFKNKKKI